MSIAMKYRWLAKKPKKIIISEAEEAAFEQATKCYLCGGEDSELVRDHDHFTGEYRGAACQSCNVKAQVPKTVPVYFHNLESFDSHFVIKSLSKLLRPPPPEVAATVESAMDVVEESPMDDDEEAAMDDDTNMMVVYGLDSDAIPKYNYQRFSLGILGTSKEKTMQLQLGPLVFRDSVRLNECSLGSWIDSQRGLNEKREHRRPLSECFPILRKFHPCMRSISEDKVEEALDLLLRKVPMAFSKLTSPAYFGLDAVLPQEAYKDSLKGKACSDESYALIKHIVQYFDLKNQGEYHDLYLYTDTLALADVVEAMRARWHQRFEIDIVHSVTMPSASYQTMLKATNAEVELLTENNRPLMDALIKNIRGGVSCIFQPYGKANNWRCLPKSLPPHLEKYASLHEQVREKDFLRGVEKRGQKIDEILPPKYINWCIANGYDPREETRWILYVDANSLYPTVMTGSLPLRAFCPVDVPQSSREDRLEFLKLLLKNYRPENQQGFFIEVTYHVPEHLHDFFDYAPVAKRPVEEEELSLYQRELIAKFRKKSAAKTSKLFPYLGEHRQVLHQIDLLQYYVELGVEVTEVHRAWSFEQAPWMASHVRTLTTERAASKDPVVKQMLKISANSLYGKTGQDPLKHRSMTPHYSKDSFAKASAKASDYEVIYDDDGDGFFGLTQPERRKDPMVDTPRAVAFSILELSKLFMLKVHYGFFRKLSAKLLMTDTDSLIYEITSDHLWKDLLQSSVCFDLINVLPTVDAVKLAWPDAVDPKGIFDELKRRHGALGGLKSESKDAAIVEFVGLAPKMYSILMRLLDGQLSTSLKGKGVPTTVLVDNTDHAGYRRMLFEPFESNVSFKKFQAFKHQVYTLQMTKKMLTPLQEKTYQVSPTESRPLGHYLNREDDAEAADAAAGVEEDDPEL
jgi:hypothetical protein